jgi:hypothetical protein
MHPDDASLERPVHPPAWRSEAVPPAEYGDIAAALASADSPVGIDAKHTHVLILHALERIERRLSALEARLAADAAAGPSAS